MIRLAVTYYPNYPYFYNSLAAYYSTREDWPHTLKYLLIACDKDPQESLFVFNIGNALAGMGKNKEARIYYRQVVKMNQYPELVDAAQNFLKNSEKLTLK
jgi:tetratricopeptide (TPR) repeat protein